jgi:hypothetical protein
MRVKRAAQALPLLESVLQIGPQSRDLKMLKVSLHELSKDTILHCIVIGTSAVKQYTDIVALVVKHVVSRTPTCHCYYCV